LLIVVSVRDLRETPRATKIVVTAYTVPNQNFDHPFYMCEDVFALSLTDLMSGLDMCQDVFALSLTDSMPGLERREGCQGFFSLVMPKPSRLLLILSTQ
jgi:hypothetical protein